MNKITKEVYKEVFEKAYDSIIIIDKNGLIKGFNQAAEMLFGYTAKEIFDKNINILMPEPYTSEHTTYINNYLKTGIKHIIGKGRTLGAKRKNGEIFLIYLSVTEIKLNKEIFFAGTIRDITEQTKNEDYLTEQRNALKSLNSELESFSYSVSHDLSAPLRHIIGYSDLLKKEIDTYKNDNAARYYNIIKEEAVRMNELIQSLLSFSRLGRKSLNKTNVDLNSLIKKIIHFYEPETNNRKIDWQIDKLPKIFCDEKMISLVWENLISNALKFTKNITKTTIKIKYTPQGHMHQLSIEDNGIGFNPRYTKDLFQVFKRLHSNKDFKGNGIGLVNIKKIIEKHSGKVWIESEENIGTKVFFNLPNHNTSNSPKSN